MFDPKENQDETMQEAITAMRMVDAEGEISSTDVAARFVNGQPSGLTVTYIMQSSDEWDRFMRFVCFLPPTSSPVPDPSPWA